MFEKTSQTNDVAFVEPWTVNLLCTVNLVCQEIGEVGGDDADTCTCEDVVDIVGIVSES